MTTVQNDAPGNGPDDRPRRPAAVSLLSPLGARPRAARGIVESLRKDIAEGRLELGSRLPNERALADHFQVSQPTVREAIRALDLMGLLDVRHGSGVYVTGDVANYVAGSLQALLSIEQVGILEVLELRSLLGRFSARQSAEKASESDIATMRGYLQTIEQYPHDTSPRLLVRPAISFQLTVSAAARNPLLFALESFLIKLIIQLQLTARGDHDSAFWRARVMSFQPARLHLLDRIATNDIEGAAQAMDKYLVDQHAVFSSDAELATASLSSLGPPGSLDDILNLPDLRPSR